MIKLIKYELYKNKLFLLLATILTVVFGAVSLPIAINGDPEFPFKVMIPVLVMAMLVYSIFIGMIIFTILLNRDIWNKNNTLLMSLPESRFKIFSAKMITGILATLVLLIIAGCYVLIYIQVLNGQEIIKTITDVLPTELWFATVLSTIGNWLYWVMTITFIIIFSKTIMGHNKNKGWVVALIAIGLIIVLPIGVSLIANASLISTSLDLAVNPEVTDAMDVNIAMSNSINMWVSIVFYWIMSTAMFVSSGIFLKKNLNI